MNITATTILKVSANSNPNKVAGALANMLREFKGGQLQAIGARANSQMIKAMAITQLFIDEDNLIVDFNTEFTSVNVDEGGELTAMRVIARAKKNNTPMYVS